MRILLTNDDGIHAKGIAAMHAALQSLGEVHVVAPADVQSAMSHAVTLHRALAVRETGLGHAVNGKPADCVKLALSELIPGPVDLVVSGMNEGANIGVAVTYSGTVSAAMEAAFLGVPAVAVSLHIGDWEHDHWDRAAAHGRAAIDAVLTRGVTPGTVMNINVPVLDGGQEPRGLRVVPASMSPMDDTYAIDTDDDGTPHYRVKSSLRFREHEPDTDVEALFDLYTTLTPLHADRNHHETLDTWRKCGIDTPDPAQT